MKKVCRLIAIVCAIIGVASCACCHNWLGLSANAITLIALI